MHQLTSIKIILHQWLVLVDKYKKLIGVQNYPYKSTDVHLKVKKPGATLKLHRVPGVSIFYIHSTRADIILLAANLVKSLSSVGFSCVCEK